MPSQTAVVGSAVGLHARPAALIAQAAGQYDEEITLATDGNEPVDAASALMIMTLGAEKGATVTVTTESPEALAEIVGLVEQDLDAS
ncbi:HPr family phosphocarrier protein [Georgenia sp. TF02-10]|uniref:HPr family phosphocarrier protein n=1 Tax=Georgenia sp. TF02-10 TaxID=2917725 RepID=UPI001FA722F0|nr:HPr family phosphocarrier protein [Georgenia sp. TF02-10]UNX53853.1 HPr family phosphocarrier protein [Georgenia sp. TF02-10]